MALPKIPLCDITCFRTLRELLNKLIHKAFSKDEANDCWVLNTSVSSSVTPESDISNTELRQDTTASGSIAAGALSVAISNDGDSDGTITIGGNTITLFAGRGITITDPRNSYNALYTLPAITYDSSLTVFTHVILKP